MAAKMIKKVKDSVQTAVEKMGSINAETSKVSNTGDCRYTNERAAIQDLTKRGFTHVFQVRGKKLFENVTTQSIPLSTEHTQKHQEKADKQQRQIQEAESSELDKLDQKRENLDKKKIEQEQSNQQKEARDLEKMTEATPSSQQMKQKKQQQQQLNLNSDQEMPRMESWQQEHVQHPKKPMMAEQEKLQQSDKEMQGQGQQVPSNEQAQLAQQTEGSLSEMALKAQQRQKIQKTPEYQTDQQQQRKFEKNKAEHKNDMTMSNTINQTNGPPVDSVGYEAKDVEMVEFHRFEGTSNPDDMSILYALEVKPKKMRGILHDAYGMHGSADVQAFIAKIKSPAI